MSASTLSHPILTIPTGYGYGNAPDHRPENNVGFAIREFAANAVTFGATDALAYAVYADGESYLLFAHNGEPPKSRQEIFGAGVSPDQTTGKGNSYQGSGMCFASSYCNEHSPNLIFGGRTKEDGLVFVGGRPNRSENRWVRDNSVEFSDKWAKIVSDLFGKATDRFSFEKQNVFYLVSVDMGASIEKDPKEVRRLILPFSMTSIAQSAPKIFESLNFYYGEKQIGYPYKDDGANKRYKSISSAVDGGGSNARRLASRDDFNERFMEFEESYETGKFQVDIGRSHGYRQIVEASARVSFRCFPGTKAVTGKDKKERQWLANLKDSSGKGNRPAYKKGAGSGIGVKPSYKGNLRVSALSIENPKSSRFQRYEDNALYALNNLGNIISSELNLPYSDSAVNPFVICDVDIISVHRLIEKTTKGDERESDIDANRLLDYLDRRADFLCRNSHACSAIYRAALGSIRDDISDKIRDWFKESFPVDKHDKCPLNLATTIRPKKNHTYEIYDLDSKDCEEFSGVLNSDSMYRFAVYDKDKKRYLRFNEMSVAGGTRGVNIQDLTKVVNQLGGNVKKNVDLIIGTEDVDKVDVVGVTISPIQELIDNEWIDVPKDEIRDRYNWTNSIQPSRGVELQASRKFAVGKVMDVPARKITKTTKENPEYNNRKKRGPESKETGYCQRYAGALVNFDIKSHILQLNENNDWVRHYFCKKTDPKSKVAKLLKSVYAAMGNVAQAHRSLIEIGARVDCSYPVSDIPADENPDYNKDDPYDFPINHLLSRFVLSDPGVLESLKRVDQHRSDEDFVESRENSSD